MHFVCLAARELLDTGSELLKREIPIESQLFEESGIFVPISFAKRCPLLRVDMELTEMNPEDGMHRWLFEAKIVQTRGAPRCDAFIWDDESRDTKFAMVKQELDSSVNTFAGRYEADGKDVIVDVVAFEDHSQLETLFYCARQVVEEYHKSHVNDPSFHEAVDELQYSLADAGTGIEHQVAALEKHWQDAVEQELRERLIECGLIGLQISTNVIQGGVVVTLPTLSALLKGLKSNSLPAFVFNGRLPVYYTFPPSPLDDVLQFITDDGCSLELGDNNKWTDGDLSFDRYTGPVDAEGKPVPGKFVRGPSRLRKD